MNDIQQDATEIARQNYVDYSKYVIKTRCYPNIRDGCKAVHKRCIYASHKALPRHLVKSSIAIGEVVKYHPHPSSIYGTLVGMASKYSCAFPVYDTKGNFGDMSNPPAAERYTELMLSDLAIKIFCPFNDYVDMVQGEIDIDEPESLATLLPLCFLQGSYGIPTGMSVVNIPPLNPIDLVKYYIDVLEHKDTSYKSNVQVKPNAGNVLICSDKKAWNEVLAKGEGTIQYAPMYEVSKDKRTVTITGIPQNKDFSDILKIFSTEIDKEYVDVRDESTTSSLYTIEILPYSRTNAKTICDKIDKELKSSIKYKFIFADGDNAVYASFYDVVKIGLDYVIKCCNKKLSDDLCNVDSRLSVLHVIESLKYKSGALKKLFDMDEAGAISYIENTYGVCTSTARTVLSKPISYLTRDHGEERRNLQEQKDTINMQLDDIYTYLVGLYKDVLQSIKKCGIKSQTDFKKR